MYAERVLGCEGDDNAGVGWMRCGEGMWVVHVVHVLCLVPLTCYG